MTEPHRRKIPENHLKISNKSIDAGTEIIKAMFKNHNGCIRVRLWNGEEFSIGQWCDIAKEAAFTIVFRCPASIRSLLIFWDRLALVKAYFSGLIDIEGDFYGALELKDQIDKIQLSILDVIRLLKPIGQIYLDKQFRNTDKQFFSANGIYINGHSRSESMQAVEYHYDLSNNFYSLWLDASLAYSCAYFESPEKSLDEAQTAKLDHICRKLSLRQNDNLLDIGCGWGALIIHAAKYYGVRAHGVTLSRNQGDLAFENISRAGLKDRIRLTVQDYRDIAGVELYEKISSVGMIEHVGIKNYPMYFSKIFQLLKPGGLILNHGITHNEEGWSRGNISSEFINRFIFPAGELDILSNIQKQLEVNSFEILDVEALRQHYALTLRHWVTRLERNHENCLRYVSESVFRSWRLYMASCALEFESGDIGVYQILAKKRTKSENSYPLTRRYMYEN